MQILCHRHCCIAFHAGAQATCAINNVLHLQNQLGATLLLRVIFATTGKPPSSRLRSDFAREQPKSRTRILTPRLHHRRPSSPSCALSTIVQVSGRGGRTGRGRPLYRRAWGICSQRGHRRYFNHLLSARGLRIAPIRLFLRSLKTLNQAPNLPQNPTSPTWICSRLSLNEMWMIHMQSNSKYAYICIICIKMQK